MIEDALRYQTQGFDWLQRVLVGGLVLFLGFFLLVPLFTFNGYMLEVMRRVMDGNTTDPPEWGDLDLVDTTVFGLKHAIVVLGFMLAVFLLAGIPFALIAVVATAADSGGLWLLAVLVGFVVYFAASLALAAVFPVATGNLVREDSIAAGFDIDLLRTVVPNRTMLTAVLYAIVVNFIIGGVSGVLGATIVGYLAVPFISFAGQSSIFYIWGEGFADAYEAEYGERPTVPDGPLKPGVTVGEGGPGSASTSGSDGPTGTPGDVVDVSDDDSGESDSGTDESDDRRWE